jgi:hypothetical protein
MRKIRPFVKEMGGLTPKELGTTINAICENGEHPTGFIDSSRWSYDFLGVPIHLEHVGVDGMKLHGEGWALTFRYMYRPYNTDELDKKLGKKNVYHFAVEVGPLYSDEVRRAMGKMGDLKSHFIFYHFRRRGSRERYRHDFSIIRLCL